MRYYSIYKILPNGKEFHFDPELKPMTHQEALTMRSKAINPSAWGIKEIKIKEVKHWK
mgnify:CR=1 FL=1